MRDFVSIAFLVTIAATKVGLGYRWSRLDHNPWSGAPLGGLFTGPKPGLFAGNLDVDQINARGRRLMITAPIATTVFLLFYLSNNHHF